ncbi:MAG: transglutaminase domain-containing protein [Planctomycetota bacterium]|jgi:hypothetical protein
MGNRALFSLLVVLIAGAVCAPARAEEKKDDPPAAPPKPDFGRINYESPGEYLAFTPEMGNERTIRLIAADLGHEDPVQRLINVHGWIKKNLRHDANAAYTWRDFDRMVKDGTFGGCADHALVFGALARALSIPTVWVKTMDYDWIRDFRICGGRCRSWRGHVFLEVYLGKKWALLDATGMKLYRNYDPKARHLPGARWAYDKGGDPFRLVPSSRWELWKEQTRAHFIDFDTALLPVAGENDLLYRDRIFIAANSPAYEWLTKKCQAFGFTSIYSFNCNFYEYLPMARRNRLIVTCVGDRLVFPEPQVGAFLPYSRAEIRKKLGEKKTGMAFRELEDGTRILLLFARDLEGMRKLVKALKKEDLK